MKPTLLSPALLCGLAIFFPTPASADPIPKEYQETVNKGLQWLADNQHRDGHWSGRNGGYPTSVTAFAGLALMMEGSTTSQGKYAQNLRQAVNWLIAQSHIRGEKAGLIGGGKNNTEISRYMFAHGYSMLFLSCAYEQEKDSKRKQLLKDVLSRASEYAEKAQSSKGGWYYVSAKDGNDYDEGATALCVLHGLHAARNAGIPVSPEVLKKGDKYVMDITSPNGGVYYSSGSRSERPAITVQALTATTHSQAIPDQYRQKWLKYIKRVFPLRGGVPLNVGHYEYAQFYLAPVYHQLGGKDWEKYRSTIFSQLEKSQSQNGSWGGNSSYSIGFAYTTSLHLVTLQMDNEKLPVFQK